MSSTGVPFEEVWLLFHTGRLQGTTSVVMTVEVVVWVVVVVCVGLVKTKRRLAAIRTPAITIAEAMAR
jgi:hypothetical protein